MKVERGKWRVREVKVKENIKEELEKQKAGDV